MKHRPKKYDSPYANGYEHHPKVKEKNDKEFTRQIVTSFVGVSATANVCITTTGGTAGIDLLPFPRGMVLASKRK